MLVSDTPSNSSKIYISGGDMEDDEEMNGLTWYRTCCLPVYWYDVPVALFIA